MRLWFSFALTALALALVLPGCGGGSGGGGVTRPELSFWGVFTGAGGYGTDAEKLRAFFVEDAPYWVIQRTRLYTQVHLNQLQSGCQWMADNADDDDVCVVYFSGHGGQVEDQEPLDEADDLDEVIVMDDGTYLYDDQFGEMIGEIFAGKRVVVILDACHSGGQIKAADGRIIRPGWGGDSFVADMARSAIAAAKRVAALKDLDDTSSLELVVLASSDDDEYSYGPSPGMEYSVWTEFLVRGMKGPADDNGDGWVTAEEDYIWAAPETTSAQPSMHPQLYDSDDKNEIPLREVD